MTRRTRTIVLRCALALIAITCFAWVAIRPSNERDWSPDQAVLPWASRQGDTLTVHNVRNATYRSVTDYDVRHDDRTYDLSTVDSVWYVVEPFAGWDGAAHTFLSFGFSDGRYLGISVEIRKERGESFSALKGMLKRYELMYVVGDERDLIGLRANHRKDDVYLYRLAVQPAAAQQLLLAMLHRATVLRDAPEFYNTLTNTCMTNIVDHLRTEDIAEIPFGRDILLPANSDRLFYDAGLLAGDGSFEERRAAAHINARAAAAADAPDFSARIRAGQ